MPTNGTPSTPRFVVRVDAATELPLRSTEELADRVARGDVLPHTPLFDAGTGVWALAGDTSIVTFIVEELGRERQAPLPGWSKEAGGPLVQQKTTAAPPDAVRAPQARPPGAGTPPAAPSRSTGSPGRAAPAGPASPSGRAAPSGPASSSGRAAPAGPSPARSEPVPATRSAPAPAPSPTISTGPTSAPAKPRRWSALTLPLVGVGALVGIGIGLGSVSKAAEEAGARARPTTSSAFSGAVPNGPPGREVSPRTGPTGREDPPTLPEMARASGSWSTDALVGPYITTASTFSDAGSFDDVPTWPLRDMPGVPEWLGSAPLGEPSEIPDPNRIQEPHRAPLVDPIPELALRSALEDAIPELAVQGALDDPIDLTPRVPLDDAIPALPAPSHRAGMDLPDRPAFTPAKVDPEVRNPDAVRQALQKEYPVRLQEAGIGGRVEIAFFVNERGAVERFQVSGSSGHEELDEAALRVAGVVQFTPAVDRGERVGAWAVLGITFESR